MKYRDFLCLALEHPDLANPSLHKVDYQGLTFDGDRMKFEKYDWYVTLMLNVCAEIARTDPKKQDMITNTLTLHKDYFCSEYWKSTFDEDYWNPRMRKLLKKVMVEGA